MLRTIIDSTTIIITTISIIIIIITIVNVAVKCDSGEGLQDNGGLSVQRASLAVEPMGPRAPPLRGTCTCLPIVTDRSLAVCRNHFAPPSTSFGKHVK